MLKKNLLDFLFPLECLGCGRENIWFCQDCFRKLQIMPRQYCIFCGTENQAGQTCQACSKIHSLAGVFSSGNYQQKELALIIKHYKYSLIQELNETLAQFLINSLNFWRKENNHDLFNSKNLLMPIPLHPKREKWRGFNQSELIAEILTKELGWEKINGLKKTKNTKLQAKLKGFERKENIANCFSFTGENIEGKKIILIDDVTTSGATLEEAAKTLKKAGAKTVWGLTIARG